MKKILLISIILCFTKLAMPQQDVRQYNYFLFDDYYLNPAYVGAKDYYSINMAYDTRFTNMGSASPKTAMLTAHSRVGKGYLFEKDGKINKLFSKYGNVSLGIQNLYYSFGPQYEYNVGVTYGYLLKLNPSVKTKRPHNMVLAFTPRLIVTGFNRNMMTNNDGIIIDNGYDQLIPPMNEYMMKANFMFDVGAIYQNQFVDIGLAALNVTNTISRYDSDTIVYGDEGFTYTLKDSIYSPRYLINAKLKMFNIVDENKLAVNFIPRTALMYAPKTENMEVMLDLAFTWDFYERITSIRRNMKYQLTTGLFINHKRNFKPYTLLQPYIGFDFLDYSILYAFNYNPNVAMPGYFGGSQISILFHLSRDKTNRRTSNMTNWK